MLERDNSLLSELAVISETSDVLELPKNVVTLVEADSKVKIISFEVFKNYLAIIQERNG